MRVTESFESITRGLSLFHNKKAPDLSGASSYLCQLRRFRPQRPEVHPEEGEQLKVSGSVLQLETFS
jgi:hypothetical protein